MRHKIKCVSPFLGLLLLIVSTQATSALPRESIVLDPSTGDYTINYLDYPDSPDAQLRQAIFVPATKIDPVVRSEFKLREESEIVYSFRITNGSKSKQALIGMVFYPVTSIISSAPQPMPDQNLDPSALKEIYAARAADLATPAGWGGTNFERQVGKLRISWGYENLESPLNGLAPGKAQGGFGFSSKDIPGIGIAQLDGHSPVPMFPAEGPTGELAKEFAPIEQNDFVTRTAAVPTIAVPDPFDPAVTLERIQTQMHTWIAMQLLDSAFSAQLDRYFQSAISAYRLNQPKVGKKQIQTMHELIKKEQPEADLEDDSDGNGDEGKTKHALIDKLAARVLDFDLKYVTKRASGNKDD